MRDRGKDFGTTNRSCVKDKSMLANSSARFRKRVDVADARFGVLVAKVSMVAKVSIDVGQRVDHRVDHRIRAARRLAACFRALASAVDGFASIDVETLWKNREFPHTAASLRRLASKAELVDRIFREFLAEHASQIDQGTVDVLNLFFAWIAEQPLKLPQYLAKYRAALEKAMSEGAEEDATTTREWSVVDADGLRSD